MHRDRETGEGSASPYVTPDLSHERGGGSMVGRKSAKIMSPFRRGKKNSSISKQPTDRPGKISERKQRRRVKR